MRGAARERDRPPRADAGPGTALAADRLGVRALLLARLLTLPTGIYLGLGSPDVHRAVAEANSAWALAWVLATTAFVWRRPLTRGLGALLVAVDTQIALTGVVATGGVDSHMCALLGALPLAIAFALRPAIVLAATAAGIATLLAAGGGDPDTSLPIAVVLAWSGLAGAVLARERGLTLARIRAQTALRAELLRAHGLAGPRERLRLADALHAGTLAEIRRLRQAAEGDAPAGDLATRCRATARAVRALVSELHAMSARPIVLRSALTQVVARRSATRGRAITLDVEEAVQGVQDELVLVAVRDLLDALPPGHPATRVTIVVGPHAGGGVQVTLDAAGEDADDARYAIDPGELALALLRERLDWIPGATLQVAGRSARVTVPATPPRVGPERVMEDQATVVGLPTSAGIAAIVAIALLDGTPSAAFWLAVAFACANTALVIAGAARTSLDLRRLFVLACCDAAALLLLIATAGPARADLRLIVIGLIPVFGFVFGPRRVAVLGAATGAGTLALAGGGAPFVVACLWSLGVALLLADAGRRAAAVVADAADRGRVALQQVMTAEEDARRAVARSLHDDALQLLFAACLDLDDAAAGGPGATAARERAAASLARAEAVVAGSSLATGGDEVPHGGLGPALRQLADRTARTSALDVAVEVPPVLPGGPHEALVYGVARELLTNVVRHAGAARVTVSLAAPPGEPLVLCVTDDGRGIGHGRLEQAVAQGHVGLSAAHDRLARVGGSLVVGPAEVSGTAVTVVVPPARR